MATQWKETYTSDEIEYTNCPLCGDDRQVPLGGQWSLTVVRCQTCSLIFVSPRLKEPEKNYWGEKEKAIAKYGPIFDGKVSHNRDKNYDMILKMIQGLKPSGNFLDIGTHCGFFLRRARDRDWNLYGVEPSPTGSALAREKFGLNVITGYLDEARFPTRFFDVVTMLDVIEHVTDPLNLLCEVHRILKDDGILLIKTPNGKYNFLKYRIFVKALRMYRLDAFDIREHIVHYGQGTIAALLQRADFRMEQCQVAYPVQVGEAWKKIGRYLAYRAALVYRALSNGLLPGFCTDMIVIAKKQG